MKQILLIVRALNFHVSLQDFSILILCPLKDLGEFSTAVQVSSDSLQLGVCNFTDKANGK